MTRAPYACDDNPLIFERLVRHVRKTLGVETQAAPISLVAAYLGRSSIIVQAISDHAEHDKHDRFRSFACRTFAT